MILDIKYQADKFGGHGLQKLDDGDSYILTILMAAWLI